MYVIGISSGIKHGRHDRPAPRRRVDRGRWGGGRFTLAQHARSDLPRGASGFCLDQVGTKPEDRALWPSALSRGELVLWLPFSEPTVACFDFLRRF